MPRDPRFYVRYLRPDINPAWRTWTEDFDYDAALENGAAARRILDEVKTLKRAGLV